tara:strand:- start:1954 stop:3795 length:1842 start_codon:yes stop_codon:yes gene_type:complete
MIEICFLRNFEEEFIEKIKDNSIIFPLDYKSLDILKSKKIKFELIDDFLTDEERKKLFLKCRDVWEKFSKMKKKELEYENINIFRIIDRNEILEYLMELFSESLVIKKIITKFSPDIIYASKEVIETIKGKDNKLKLIEIYEEHEKELTFDYVNIRKKIWGFEINSKISRKQFKKIKNVIHILNKILNRNNDLDNDERKILFFEFDPNLYKNLLKQVRKIGYTPVLINFRKPAISSKVSFDIIRETKSIVFSPGILKIDKTMFREIEEKCKKLINFVDRNHDFLEFDIFDLKLSKIIKNQVLRILNDRLEDYIRQINYFKLLDERNDIVAGISLNLSGETEMIFSKIRKNTPLILLQHGFSNYYDFNSYLDNLDDYDLLCERIAVWGNPVRDYLIKKYNFKEENILVSGSPRHENFNPNKKINFSKKNIVITPRPLIKHVEGTKLKLQLRYENMLQKLILCLKNINNVNIIFKLHPQQNIHNDIMKSVIKKLDSKIIVLQDESIKEILDDAYLLINISTDNLDVSTVIFESMLINVPIINLKLQKNNWEYDIEKNGAVISCNYDSDYENEILNLINNKIEYVKQISEIKKFLEFYLKNKQNASEELIRLINKQ